MNLTQRSHNARKGWMVRQLRLMAELTTPTLAEADAVKRCCTCNQCKPLDQFFKNKLRPSGIDPQCRACHKSRYRIRYRKNKDSENYRAAKRLTASKYRTRHKEITEAHRIAASKKKLLKKSKCERCGCAGVLHMHHPDYRKPLKVVTLCVPCHEHVHHGEIK